MNHFLRAALLSLVSVLALSALAQADTFITVEQPWLRASPPGAPGAGFMIVHNAASADDRLLAVRGDFASRLEIHLSQLQDGVMRMQAQPEGVVIPAQGQIRFAPGGYHLMFMGLAKPLSVGEHYTLWLDFERAGTVQVMFPVAAAGDMPAHN